MTNTRRQQPVSLTVGYRDWLKNVDTPLLDLVKQTSTSDTRPASIDWKTVNAVPADTRMEADDRSAPDRQSFTSVNLPRQPAAARPAQSIDWKKINAVPPDTQTAPDYLTAPDRVSLYEMTRGTSPAASVPAGPAEPLDRQSFTSVNPKPEALFRTIENTLRDWGEQRDEWLRKEVARTWEEADEDQDLRPNPYRRAGEKGLARGDEWDYDEFERDLWPQTAGRAEAKAEETGDGYLDKVMRQLVMGNYTDDVTVLGTLGQMLLGFGGLDTAADIRDLTYDLMNWEWSPEHVRQTLLDAIGFIPAIGIMKNADEVGAILKGILGNPEAAAAAARALLSGSDAISAAARRGTELLDGLGTLLKNLPEQAGTAGTLALGTLKTVGDYADEAGAAVKAAGHLDEASDAWKAVERIDKASDAAEAAAKGLTGTLDLPSAPARAATKGAGNVGKIITKIEYTPSSGAILKANPNKTTTILGSFDKDMKNIVDEMGNVKSTYFGARKGGFNILNVPDDIYKSLTREQFWEKYNKRWLDEAINRGDDIFMATKPEGPVLSYVDRITGEEVITGFGREYNYLIERGYVYDAATNMMIKR